MSEKTPLATIRKIVDIKAIADADKIELAYIDGWQVVVAKKDNFKVGDMVVYVEINSQMPEKPEYEFLKPRRYRVRTIKLKKMLSQGLILPLSYLPKDLKIIENLDVGETLGICKYDPEAQEEKDLQTPKHQNKVLRFCMGFAPFRKVYMALNQKEKGSFPSDIISKSDEENLQNCAEVIMNNFDKRFYINEKIEGQSSLFYTNFDKRWGFKRKIFGVCSRNLRLAKPDNSKYWASAKKYDLEKILKGYKGIVAVQAEQTGEGIQGNIYKINGVELFVFNVKLDGKRLNYNDMLDFCVKHNLKTVPLINPNFIPSENISCNDKASVVKWLLDYSNGKSMLYDTLREGIVVRLWETPEISFKVKSPDYLIKHET
jgi:RNA ligase (TIGR02306 family)